MAQNFWEQDAVIQPVNPAIPRGMKAVPLTGVDRKKVAEGENAPAMSAEQLEAIRLQNDQRRRDLSGPQGNMPVGYRYNAETGQAERIPGLPVSNAEGKPLPNWAVSKFEKPLAIFGGLDRSLKGFQDDFAGNTLTGDLENKIQGKIGSFGTEGQRNWWAAFKEFDNKVRNELFGATLTPSEQAAYLSTTIDPSLDPKILRENLTKRRDVVAKAVSRQYNFMKAQGYNPEAVDALAGEYAPEFNPSLRPPEERESDPAAADVPTDAPSDQAPPALNLAPDGSVIYDDSKNTAPEQGIDTGLIGEDAATQTVVDPKWAGANAELDAMLRQGTPISAFAQYLKGRGASGEELTNVMRQVQGIRQWQAQNPGYKGGFKVDVERKVVPVAGWQRFANSDVGVAATSAVDAATGFTTDNVVGMAGGDAATVRARLDAAQAAHPKSALAGTVAGGVTSAIAAEAALAKAGMQGIARTLTADGAYGLAAGAGGTDLAPDGTAATLGDRALGAAKGAVAAGVGGAVGQGIAKAGKAMVRGTGDTYVSTINSESIPTTVGQQYGQGRLGGIIKRTEDRIAGLPVVGDIINARRLEGIKKFNGKAFDRALKPIGEQIGDRVGEEAVDFAQNKISDAFERALVGKAVRADAEFADELTKAVTSVRSLPRVGSEVADGVREVLEPYMKAGDDLASTITGESMQQMSRELRDLRASYFTSNDPMKNRIGKEIEKVENAIFGVFRRQAPEVLPAYNAAKAAQRRLYTVADAVNKAKNKEGIFMPSQLGAADKSATIKTEGKVAAARGRGQFQDLQRAAQEVLPSEIPDSGTAGRILIPGVALGVGGGADATGATGGAGMTLAGILTLAYTRAGQRLLTKPGRGTGGTAKKILESEKTRKALTAGGGATGALVATQ